MFNTESVGFCRLDRDGEPPVHRDGLFFRISMPDTSLLVNDQELFEELRGQLGLLNAARMAVDGQLYACEYAHEDRADGLAVHLRGCPGATHEAGVCAARDGKENAGPSRDARTDILALYGNHLPGVATRAVEDYRRAREAADRQRVLDYATLDAAAALTGTIESAQAAHPGARLPPFKSGLPAFAARSSRVWSNGRKRRSCSPVRL